MFNKDKCEKEGGCGCGCCGGGKKIFMIVWLVITILLVVNFGWNLWDDYKNLQFKQNYDNGRKDVMSAFLNEGQKCKPFSVEMDQQKDNFMAISCLQKMQETQNATSTGTTKGKTK